MLTELAAGTRFSALDWGIVAVYVAGIVWLGLRARRRIADMADFLVAGRFVRTALGVASMSATEMALVTVMYSAQKGFVGGFAAMHIAVLAAVVTFAVGWTGFIVARLRREGVMTIPEYYGKRFGTPVRVLGGLMLALGGILNMGLFIKVAAMFITALTGMTDESMLLAVMVALVVLVLLYTMLGGMVADLVTDYAQFVVMALAMIPATLLAVRHVGWDGMVAAVLQVRGVQGVDPLAEGTFGTEYVVWMAFTGMVSCAIWPTAVARALSAESPGVVRRLYMWSSLGFLVRFLIPYLWGICALAYVAADPVLTAAFLPADGGDGVSNLYAVPVFLGRVLPAGLLGVLLAGMLAAEMSTHDSYLLSWSSVLTQDVVAPLTGDRMSPRARIRLTRVFMALIAVYLIYWGMVYRGRDDIWDYMAVSGAIYFTGAFALLALGLYWKRASSGGALLALACGGTALLGLSPVQDLLGLRIPSARVGLATVGLTVAAMVLGSLLFPQRRARA